jgi:hypothetical protein
MFGSDFPFGDPNSELQKVRSLQPEPAILAAVLGGNFIRLQSRIGRRQSEVERLETPVQRSFTRSGA